MGMRKRLLLLNVLALQVAGCQSVPETSAPTKENAQALQASIAPATLRRASETLLVTLSSQVSAFAGYYCEAGHLVIRVADTTTSPTWNANVLAIKMALPAGLFKDCGNTASLQTVTAAAATYSFSQLRAWRDQLSEPFLETTGATGIYIDYPRNRIGFTATADTLATAQGFITQHLPTDAYTLNTEDGLREDFACAPPFLNVQQCFAPVPGGVVVATTDNGSNECMTDVDDRGNPIMNCPNRCTIGPAAQLLTQSGWTDGWVVNSHCTFPIWRMDSNWMWQPGNGPPIWNADFIGFEFVDPEGWSCGSRECRYSDAAWVWAAPKSSTQLPEIGYIAKTEIASTAINMIEPRFKIIKSRYATVGMLVNKVGKQTGWTQGTVQIVCGDYNRTSQGRLLRMICQDRASYGRANGDSGAPVFFIREGGRDGVEVDLLGIHWGFDFDSLELAAYSPWDGIVTDLGLLSAYAP